MTIITKIIITNIINIINNIIINIDNISIKIIIIIITITTRNKLTFKLLANNHIFTAASQCLHIPTLPAWTIRY